MDTSIGWLWALPMFSGGVCLAATLWLWGLREDINVKRTIILLLLLAWWGVANGAVMMASARDMKLLFYRSEGIAVLGVPSLVLLKAILLYRPGFRLNRWVTILGACLLLGLTVFHFSDHFSHFLYEEVPGPSGFVVSFLAPKLPFWFIFLGIPLAMCSASLVLFLLRLPTLDQPNRRHVTLYILGILAIGLAAFLFYGLGLTPSNGFDPTPSMVGLGGLFVVYATLRFSSHRHAIIVLDMGINDMDVRLFTFRVATSVVIPSGVVFSALAIHSERYLTAATLIMMLMMMALGFLLLHEFKDQKTRAKIYASALSAVAFLFGCISIITISRDGDLGTIPWALLFPVLVIFGLGPRVGFLCILLFFSAFLGSSILVGNFELTFLTPLGIRFWMSFSIMTIILLFMEHARLKYLKLLTIAQEELRQHRDSLEGLVDQRTGDLTKTVSLLQHEIVQRKMTQSALVEAKNIADQANRTKTEFLANMSHELRTPLTHILGFADVLREGYAGPLNEQQLEYINYMITSSNHLHALINDLLDMARLEVGALELEMKQTNLEALMAELISAHSLTSTSDSITFETSFHDLPTDMVLDPDKVKQVISILLANAVKFSRFGGGRILVEAWGRDGEASGDEPYRREPHVEIVVSDQGIGLNEDDLERIFKSFEQVDSSSTRQFDGSGLGLALARHLVEMHGGRIWAESRGAGQGSQFHVLLPWVVDSNRERK
jgi:signal transduction histidine kinase